MKPSSVPCGALFPATRKAPPASESAAGPGSDVRRAPPTARPSPSATTRPETVHRSLWVGGGGGGVGWGWGDGLGDPGCSDALDASEHGTVMCDDGIDNDDDGSVDYNVKASMGDPGCTAPDDASEQGTLACDDGEDNDGDGITDFKVVGPSDPGCDSAADPSEHGTLICDNGLDDDNDGAVDGDDAGCSDLTDTSEHCSGPTCAAITTSTSYGCSTSWAICCSAPGGSNRGTSMRLPALRAAVSHPRTW